MSERWAMQKRQKIGEVPILPIQGRAEERGSVQVLAPFQPVEQPPQRPVAAPPTACISMHPAEEPKTAKNDMSSKTVTENSASPTSPQLKGARATVISNQV